MLRDLYAPIGSYGILGVPASGILASIIAAETAAGDNGAGVLYDDSLLSESIGKELRCRVTSLPSAGALFVYENGAVDFTGAPVGTYSAGYAVDADNIEVRTDTATFTVSVAGTNVAIGSSSGTGVGSGTGGTVVAGTGGISPAVSFIVSPASPVFAGSMYVVGATPTTSFNSAPDSPIFIGGVSSTVTGSFSAIPNSPIFIGGCTVYLPHISTFLKYVVKDAQAPYI